MNYQDYDLEKIELALESIDWSELDQETIQAIMKLGDEYERSEL